MSQICAWYTFPRAYAQYPYYDCSVTWNSKSGYAEQYDAVSIQEGAWARYAFDITALAHGWIRGKWANYGLAVRGPEHSGSDSFWREFGTSESTDGPCVRITYAPPINAKAGQAPESEARELNSGLSMLDYFEPGMRQ